jgi:hypothetical protein
MLFGSHGARGSPSFLSAIFAVLAALNKELTRACAIANVQRHSNRGDSMLRPSHPARTSLVAFAAASLLTCAATTAAPQGPRERAVPSLRHGWLSPAARHNALVYVSDNAANAIEIYRQGQSDPSPVGQIVDGIDAPLGDYVDAQGTLYVANSGNSTVTEYPAGSTTPSVTLSTDISHPISVAVNSKGTVAVGEFSAGTILEFSAGQSSPSVTITLLTLPEALAFDRTRHLFAAWNVDNGSGLAGHVSRCERLRAVCVDQGIVEGESGGLALDHAGNVILGDQTNAVINIYAAGATTPSRSIATTGHDPYKFELDQRERTLYVADITGGVVVLYDYASGSQLGTISKGLTSAWGVALSPAATDGP